MFVVTRAHEKYYREGLRNVDESQIIPQPLNRGTGVAVAVALLHLLQRDVDAVVAFVPCDHYYADDEAFGQALRSAFLGAEQYPDSVVLLGAKADYAEVEYGWMELGSLISNALAPLWRVNRFWEKPSLPRARALLRRGCLWNTFVTVGRASAFVDLLSSHRPEMVLSINEALAENELEAAYQLMPAVDLSRHVLALRPRRLLAIPDMTSGWADLGSPARVMDTLARNNIQPAWSRDKFTESPDPSGHRYQVRRDNTRQDLAGIASTGEEDVQG
jgi:mannose-1-phosphate guanylyltransferase